MPRKIKKPIYVEPHQTRHGEWYLLNATTGRVCCDCGLTHTYKYKTVDEFGKTRIIQQVLIDEQYTKEIRKREKFKCKPV